MHNDFVQNGPLSVFLRAEARQPKISKRVVPMIANLAKICPGIADLMTGTFFGVRGANTLDDAEAQFLPKDILPSSSYTQGTKGAYITGFAVSKELSLAAAKQVKADAVAARNGIMAKHLVFADAIVAFVGKDKDAKFLVFPYSGIGTQGKSSIYTRFWDKFGSKQFIAKWFRTCASIATEMEGGMSAHMRFFHHVAVTKPTLDELFLHAGKPAGYRTTLEFEYDIEALFGGAFLGGRLVDGGLNVGGLGSLSLDGGWDSRGLGPGAYAILDTAKVLEQVSRKEVEERSAVVVFEDVRWALESHGGLRNLIRETGTFENVLAVRDVKERVLLTSQMIKAGKFVIEAGEFARWLNAAGGRASAVERKRLRETDASELTPMERGKKRRMRIWSDA